MSYRKIVSDGDLILQKKAAMWALFNPRWINWRNLSEEVRLLQDHVDRTKAVYEGFRKLQVIAKKNVEDDISAVEGLKSGNTEYQFITPVDNSIFGQREGVHYQLDFNPRPKIDGKPKEERKKSTSMSPLEWLTSMRIEIPETKH